MKKILEFCKEYYLIFIFFLLIVSSYIFLIFNMPTIWILTYTFLWFFILAMCLNKLKNYKQDNYYNLYENTKNKLDETINLCHQWKDHADEWKRYANELQQKYFQDVDLIIRETKHSAIFPQQQAILSNLTENSVSASTIKSLMEFTKNINNESSIFLIKVNHSNSSWYFELTGKSIELDQALFVIEGVKNKIINPQIITH